MGLLIVTVIVALNAEEGLGFLALSCAIIVCTVLYVVKSR